MFTFNVFFSVFFSVFIPHTIFASEVENHSQNNCKEILKSPIERDQNALMEEIFGPGDALAKELFENTGISFQDRSLMDKNQRREFLKLNTDKIYEHLIQQGTQIQRYPVNYYIKGSTSYVVQGGKSRLGRVATALWEKRRYSLILDFSLFNQYAMIDTGDRQIVLSLEDAFYPNHISLSLLHEIRHLHNFYENLVTPKIDSLDPTIKSYQRFSLDEVIVMYKDIQQMLHGAKNVKSQYVTFYQDKSGGSELSEYTEILKDLSARTLLKKNEFLKISDYLKEIEKDPTFYSNRSFMALFEAFSPKIYFPYLDLWKYSSLEEISKAARSSVALIEKALAIAELVSEKGVVP